MAIRGKPPERGLAVASWSFDRVPAGEVREGWLAGPIHGLICHCSGASKPCRKVLLGSTAECPECSAGKGADWIGYVPLRRHDGRPVVVCIRASGFEIASTIKPTARVKWGRDRGRGEGVWLMPATGGASWRHYYGDDQADADLIGWLCRLWRLPELLPALGRYLSLNECQPTVTAPLPAPVEAVAIPPAVADRARPVEGASPLVVTVDEIESDIQKRLKRWNQDGVSSNGKK